MFYGRSKAFKREYDDLKMKMNNAVESSHSAFLKQRSFRNEYQEAKLEQGEARKYEDLLKELVCCLTGLYSGLCT